MSVLKSLGLDEIEHQDCYIELLNKIDLLDDQQRRWVEETKRRSPGVLPVSALTGEGCKEFLDLLDKRLSGKRQKISLSVENADGALAAWIYRHAEVLSAVVGERQTDFEILSNPQICNVCGKKRNCRLELWARVVFRPASDYILNRKNRGG